MINKIQPASFPRRVGRDLLASFKLLVSPECRLAMPLWEFAKYFANLEFNKLPGVRRLVAEKAQVDLRTYIQVYDRTTATLFPYRSMLGRIVEKMNLSGGEVVVDLGSGSGNLSERARGAGAFVVSVDSADESIALHRQKNPRAAIIKADLDRPDSQLGFIDWPDHSIDRVCCANVMLYIKNRATLYAEIKRLLARDGRLVIQVEKEGYSPVPILKSHLLTAWQGLQRQGLTPLAAAIQVYMDFIACQADWLVVSRETTRLMRGVALGRHTLFSVERLVGELNEAGFVIEQNPEETYAGQGLIVVARPR